MPFLPGRLGEGQLVMTGPLVTTAQLADQLAWGTPGCSLSQCPCPFSGKFLSLQRPSGYEKESSLSPRSTCAAG